MTTDTSTPLADGNRIGMLWVASLLPAAATLAGLEIAYLLVDRACTTGNLLPVHLTWAVSLGLASASYYLLERPILRWRNSYRVRSERSPALKSVPS